MCFPILSSILLQMWFPGPQVLPDLHKKIQEIVDMSLRHYILRTFVCVLFVCCIGMCLPGASEDTSSVLDNTLSILSQKPNLKDYLLTTLDFDAVGHSPFISPFADMPFAGSRVCPYSLYARPKGKKGAASLKVVLGTERTYLDANGEECTQELAHRHNKWRTDTIIGAHKIIGAHTQ